MSKKGNIRLQPLSNDPEGAPGSSLQQIKVQQKAREDNEKIRLKRVKGAIVLISQFLLDQGYVGSLQMLQQESGLSLQKFSPADNIDLLSIIMEYEQYFEFRFNRRPKLFRANEGVEEGCVDVPSGGERMAVRRRGNEQLGGRPKPQPLRANGGPITYGNAASVGEAPQSTAQELKRPGPGAQCLARGLVLAHKASPPLGPSPSSPPGSNARRPVVTECPFGLAGMRVEAAPEFSGDAVACRSDDDGFFGRALKPLPRFPTVELQELAMTIQRDILDSNPNVRWGSIAALDEVKRLLKEAVVMPVKYPELFAGIVRPWKGILLFGPPGTGKTLLAKAVATECRTTFFNISASSVVSKWRGDSEKLVRLLFDIAVHYAPSTIFIDEIDSLMSARGGEGTHEGSRRMKTELLIQMDGLSKRRGGEVVFVLAASNTPWDLDSAMLRRLEKRILVGLPTHEARATMFRQILTASAASADIDWNACAAATDGMSGADIDVICREAMMRPIRLMIEKLEGAGSPSDLKSGVVQRPVITMQDIMASVACTQSSVQQSDLSKFEAWARKYGSGASS